MYCTRCGEQLPDNANFCGYCGQKMSLTSEPAATGQGRSQSSGKVLHSKHTQIGDKGVSVPGKGGRFPLRAAIIAAVVLLAVGIITAVIYRHRSNSDKKTEKDTIKEETSESVESRSDSEEIQTETHHELTATVTGTVPENITARTELYFTTAAATSELVQENTMIYNGAVCAVDGDIITSWQEGAVGNGIGETLTIGFSEAQRVCYLELNVGNWRDELQWNRNLRPKRLEITVNGEKLDAELQNVRASQYLVFSDPVETTEFVIKIADIYTGAEGESDVCISEIRAFGKAQGKNERIISDTQPKSDNSK